MDPERTDPSQQRHPHATLKTTRTLLPFFPPPLVHSPLSPMPLFQRIELETTCIEPQRAFYTGSLELKLVESGEGSFAVQCGQTILAFTQVEDTQPRQYHFAIDIPTNKLEEALQWANARFPIATKPDGTAIYSFESWNARALYFLDAERNILEFITRGNSGTDSPEPFSVDQILYISELGVVTENVVATANELKDNLGLPCFPDSSQEPNPEFQAIGSNAGLFIVVRAGRSWLGGEGTAQPFPSIATIENGQNLALADTFCEIKSARS